MPNRPGKDQHEIDAINTRLPMTFKMMGGRSTPPVGRDEAVFYENFLANPDGKGQLYFRRHGRVYVIDATTAYNPNIPPGTGPAFRLIDDDWLCWSPTLTTPIPDQRSAGIRWHVSSVTPDRFEFDVGNGNANENTRMYLLKWASGQDASLAISPRQLVLADASTYSAAPATTVYRGDEISGSVSISQNGGSGGGGTGSNFLTDPGFESWNSGSSAISWWDGHLGSETRSSTAHSGSFAALLTSTAAQDGSILMSRSSAAPHTTGVMTLTAGLTYEVSFWYRSTHTGRATWTIWHLNVDTDINPAHSLVHGAGVSGPTGGWAIGESAAPNYPYFDMTGDSTYHQVTTTFVADPPGVTTGTTFKAILLLINGGSSGSDNSGGNWLVDDASIRVVGGGTITAPITLRLWSNDRASIIVQTGSTSTFNMDEVTGVWNVPTFKPITPDLTSVITVTAAYGQRIGFALNNTANTGTTTVPNTYTLYAEEPGFGTTKYAGYFAGNIGLASNKLLKIFGTSTGFTSIVGGAQGGTNIAWTLPTAQGAANSFLQNNGSGALSWVTVAGAGGATSFPTDSGTATPVAGVVNVLGTANEIATSASGNTITIGLVDPLIAAKGGTGFASYTVGDLLYADTTTTLARLAGTTAGNWLRAAGTGTAPAWQAPAALTRVDDTNVTLTLGGAPTTALLTATSLTLGWTGQLGLTRGGTAASLTAVNGGIVYSTASALAISAAGASGQILRSAGAAAPTWSTATYPATAGTSGNVLTSDGTNWQSTAPSRVQPITTKTNTDYTLTTSDYTVLFSTGSSNRTATLPTAASASGLVFNIKKIDAGSGTVIIDGNGSETIDGATTVTLTDRYTSLQIQSDGSAWYVI